MEPTDEVKHAAELISFTLHSDSSLYVEPKHFAKRIQADMLMNGGECPTDEECDCIIVGEDNGEIPEDLIRRFPNLNSFLESLF